MCGTLILKYYVLYSYNIILCNSKAQIRIEKLTWYEWKKNGNSNYRGSVWRVRRLVYTIGKYESCLQYKKTKPSTKIIYNIGLQRVCRWSRRWWYRKQIQRP